MKEADKSLLNEIAHLSRLIKKKEKIKHVTKRFSNFPPTQFNPSVNVNKFKFFKPSVTAKNVFSKSKYPTSTTNKFKFCKPASAIVPNSVIAGSSSVNINRSIATPVLHNPNDTGTTLISKVDKGTGNPTNSQSSSRIFVNPKFASLASTSSMLDVHVARGNLNNNPYKFRKAEFATSSITDDIISSGEKYSLKGNAKIDAHNDSGNLLVPISKSACISQTPAPIVLPTTKSLFHSNSQRTVGLGNMSAKTSVGVSYGTNIKKSDSTYRQIVKFKHSHVQPEATHNQYKLDRRTKSTGQRYSLITKNGPKRLKRCDSKNTNKKYIVTRHSLRKLKDSPKRLIVKGRRIAPISSKYAVASKIVKIQGATYESRNKGKTLKRIRTSSTSFSQLSKLEFKSSQTPVKKLASQVLKKCKTLIKNRQKRNVFCKFYNMFGVCKRLEDGACRFVHDSRQVFVCSKFIVGKCGNENCALSHNLDHGKIPPCRFFKIGRCTRKDCPYSHVESKKKMQMRKLKLTSTTAVKDVKVKEKRAVLSVAKKIKCDTETPGSKTKVEKNVPKCEKSRYYQRIPNSNPVKALIPRRLPLSLVKQCRNSDSESDTDVSDSDESETTIIADISNREFNSVKKEETLNPLVDSNAKLKDTGEIESNKSILQSVAIMASTATIGNDVILGGNHPVTDSTSEKRLRLLGLQNNLKRRVAAIRNENLSAD